MGYKNFSIGKWHCERLIISTSFFSPMAAEEEDKSLVYIIERGGPGFYYLDVARRLVSAEEMAERIAEEMRTPEPLSHEEMRFLDESGLVHSQDPAQPSAWKDWLCYERMDGTFVQYPPSCNPTVKELGQSGAAAYINTRYEDELNRFESGMGSLVDALKQLGFLANAGDEPVLSLEMEFY